MRMSPYLCASCEDRAIFLLVLHYLLFRLFTFPCVSRVLLVVEISSLASVAEIPSRKSSWVNVVRENFFFVDFVADFLLSDVELSSAFDVVFFLDRVSTLIICRYWIFERATTKSDCYLLVGHNKRMYLKTMIWKMTNGKLILSFSRYLEFISQWRTR